MQVNIADMTSEEIIEYLFALSGYNKELMETAIVKSASIEGDGNSRIDLKKVIDYIEGNKVP